MVWVFSTLLRMFETTVCVFVTSRRTSETTTSVFIESSVWKRSQQWPYRSERTHVKDMEDPVEVQLPGGDHFFIVLRVEVSRDDVSFTPLDDVLLNLGHGPLVESLVSEPPSVWIIGSTYVVNCSIASNTDRLNSSARLPFNPRSRALHASAQASPRST